MKIFITSLLLIFPSLVLAENSLTADLSATSVTLTNWKQGGTSATSWVTHVQGKNIAVIRGQEHATEYLFKFGRTKVGDTGYQTSSDRFRVDHQITQKLGFFLDPYIAGTLVTQTSDYRDPLELSQSAGVGFNTESLNSRIGLASLETYEEDLGWVTSKAMESVTNMSFKCSDVATLTGRQAIYFPYYMI